MKKILLPLFAVAALVSGSAIAADAKGNASVDTNVTKDAVTGKAGEAKGTALGAVGTVKGKAGDAKDAAAAKAGEAKGTATGKVGEAKGKATGAAASLGVSVDAEVNQ